MSATMKTTLEIIVAVAVAGGLGLLAFTVWWQWGHVTYSDKAEAAACWQQADERFPPDLEITHGTITGPDGVARASRSEFDRNSARRNAFADACIRSCRNRKVLGLSFCW